MRGSGNTAENLRRKSRDGFEFATLDDMYMSGKSVIPLSLAEWEERNEFGTRLRLMRGRKAVKQAPKDAARYFEKTFTFPTGIVQELIFEEANGGVFRAITTETLIYMLEGSGTLELGNEVIRVEQGDAVSHPTGVLRGNNDAKVIAWSVSDTYGASPNTRYSDPVPTLLRGADSVITESASWDVDGERVIVKTPEEINAAPEDAIRLKLAALNYEHNMFAKVTSYKGGPTYESPSRLDNYLYVVSGAYRYFQDDVEFEARPGDVIREISGHYHHWIRHEDSSFVVSTSLPIPLSPEHNDRRQES